MISREYHQSLSKQRMNDNRYNVRGSTHRKGTLATSRQTWFVVASSRTEGTMAKANHKSCVCHGGLTLGVRLDSTAGKAFGTVAGRAWRAATHAQLAHKTAKR